MSGEVVAAVYRRRLCAADCGTVFYICRSCDRGQRYCSDRCRQKNRRSQRRQANRKHQQSPEGRLDHRDRQRLWRERRRRCVTDQGRKPAEVSATIPPVEIWTIPSAVESPVDDLLFCIVCGRSGHYIETFYRSG
jgi:hypothetical protein